jgi:hypothetical protein
MRVGKDGKQRQPGAQETAEGRAEPAELLGGTEQFGWPSYTAGVGARLSRSRDYASPGSIPFSIRSNVGNRAIWAATRRASSFDSRCNCDCRAGWSSKWTVAKFRPAPSRTS